MKELDVAVIGAGPAGMAAAIKLSKINIRNIMIFERKDRLGGILDQCIHSGFGIDYYNEELTGPEYSKKMIDEFIEWKIPYQLNSMVINIQKDKVLTVSSKEKGIQQFRSKAIIISTYALCGFANFSSIAIQIGGIGGIAPKRKSDIARFGLKAILGGSLATFMTATIAGVLTSL